MMKENLKRILRQILIRFRIPITKNIRYDIFTEDTLRAVLKADSNCLDVGAHKGEILELLLRLAPEGKHSAFEPIPKLYNDLLIQYGKKADIYPFALSIEAGKTQFNVVTDDPAYSGIRERDYKNPNTPIEKINVEMRRLDEVLKNRTYKIHLIKIDVEGGEFDVLRGATEILKIDKPILVFECGRGASEYYGTKPDELYSFLTSFNYSIQTLGGFVKKQPSLKNSDFVSTFENRTDYYFVAV
jgi:FkbM family methyltransferase